MPQSRDTALQRHKKKERWGTINENTNSTYENKDVNKEELEQMSRLWKLLGVGALTKLQTKEKESNQDPVV